MFSEKQFRITNWSEPFSYMKKSEIVVTGLLVVLMCLWFINIQKEETTIQTEKIQISK